VLGYEPPPLTPSPPAWFEAEPPPADAIGIAPADAPSDPLQKPERVTIVASKQIGPAPLVVVFEVLVEPSGPSADATFDWTIDGAAAAAQQSRLVHTFPVAGTYRVECCVRSKAWPGGPVPCAGVTVVAEQAQAEAGNLPPVGIDGEHVAEKGGEVELQLRGADPENRQLRFTVIQNPAHGTLGEVRPAGPDSAVVVYTPTEGFSGLDEVRFLAADEEHASLPARIRVVVLDDLRPPVIGHRVPQWPLKTDRILYTPEQVNRARMLCATDAGAIGQLKAIRNQAAYWMQKTDQELRDLIPDSRVPRAFDVSAGGCPVHGTAIHAHGPYPWILDRENPFAVVCPVGGERYPGNDFREYYRSGFRDPRYLSGPYADNGRGWVSPGGEKYWFVAYACHWNWYSTWRQAVICLSRAYLLTGNRDYARKAIVLLDRFAEVYPGMDYDSQSRYGELSSSPYPGKVVNAVWETALATDWVVCYDMVHDALTGEDALSLPWRSAQEIRANIEANLLEEIIDAVERLQIRGNYGMHQRTLAFTAAVRQHAPLEPLVGRILNRTGGAEVDEGLQYALYNLVSRDGFPNETSPSYNSIWVNAIAQMSLPLRLCGYDLMAEARVRALFDAPLQTLCAGLFTPALGDAGGIRDGWIVPQPSTFETAYLRYADPAFAWAMVQMGAVHDRIRSFEGIFSPLQPQAVLADASTFDSRRSSRFFDGYGLGILNNAADNLAVAMRYGPEGLHAHRDSLGIELFGRGRRLSPDLGYPDAMNAFVPGIYSWSQNTVSHNCLVVDHRKAAASRGGNLLRFHDAPFVHVLDARQPDAYEQTDVYRRTLVLVDVGDDNGYLVDVFRVRGGSEHVLSLHGLEGSFQMLGVALPPPVAEGTLAGPSVGYGVLYDDPVLGAPGYQGSFGSYRGSGYQHLFNWQSAVMGADPVTAVWSDPADPSAQLRVHLPARPGQQIIVADAYVSPQRRVPTVLKYVLLRRAAGPEGNTFACVWEVNGGTPIIDAVETHADPSLGSGSSECVAISVHRGSAVDTIVVADEPGLEYTFPRPAPDAPVTADAAVLMVTSEAGAVSRAFAAGGSRVRGAGGQLLLDVPPTVRGTILSVDYRQARILVAAEANQPTADALVGRMVRVYNASRSSAYTIAAALAGPGTLTLRLAGADLFTGRARLDSVDPPRGLIRIRTTMWNPSRFSGMTLINADLSHTARIEALAGSAFRLADGSDLMPFLADLQSGGETDVWISDVGPGDQVEVERFGLLEN